MGCARRLGCLVLLVALGALVWATRDRWGPSFPRARAFVPGAPATTDSAASGVPWQPVTRGGASHTEHLVLGLADRGSAPYVAVPPGDFAAFVLMDIAGQVPPDVDSTRAAIVDHRLAIRTSLDIKTLGGRTAFGPVGGLLADREPLTLAGTFDVVRRGVAEFRVEQISVHGLPVPRPLIPQLVRKVEVGAHPAGLAADALLVNVPPYVTDIRVSPTRIVLYRSVP